MVERSSPDRQIAWTPTPSALKTLVGHVVPQEAEEGVALVASHALDPVHRRTADEQNPSAVLGMGTYQWMHHGPRVRRPEAIGEGLRLWAVVAALEDRLDETVGGVLHLETREHVLHRRGEGVVSGGHRGPQCIAAGVGNHLAAQERVSRWRRDPGDIRVPHLGGRRTVRSIRDHLQARFRGALQPGDREDARHAETSGHREMIVGVQMGAAHEDHLVLVQCVPNVREGRFVTRPQVHPSDFRTYRSCQRRYLDCHPTLLARLN